MSGHQTLARPAVGAAQPGWERFFWLVFNRSTIPMTLLNERRVGVAFNRAACDYMRRPRTELVGRKIDADVAPQAVRQFTDAWERQIRLGDWIGNVDLIRADGVVLHPEFATRATLIDGRRLVLGVMLVDHRELADTGESHDELTPREQTVVHLLTLGLTSSEMSERLSISESTARTHVRNAMAKTGTRTRAQLVAVALADGRTQRGSERDGS